MWPGVRETDATLRPTIALSSDVLPTLGWPTKPTVVIRTPPAATRALSLSSASASPSAAASSAAVGVALGGFGASGVGAASPRGAAPATRAPAIRRSIASSSSSLSSSSSSPPPPPPSSSIADDSSSSDVPAPLPDARRRHVAPRRLVALVALLVAVGARVRRLLRRRPDGGGGGGLRRRRRSAAAGARRTRRRRRPRCPGSRPTAPTPPPRATSSTRSQRPPPPAAAAGRRQRDGRTQRDLLDVGADGGALRGRERRGELAPPRGDAAADRAADGAALGRRARCALAKRRRSSAVHDARRLRDEVDLRQHDDGAHLALVGEVGVQRRRDVEQRVARVGDDAEHVAALEHPPQLAPHLDVVLERRELRVGKPSGRPPPTRGRRRARARPAPTPPRPRSTPAAAASRPTTTAPRSRAAARAARAPAAARRRAGAPGRPRRPRARTASRARSSRPSSTPWMKRAAAAAVAPDVGALAPRVDEGGWSRRLLARLLTLRHELALLLAADAGAAAHHGDGKARATTQPRRRISRPPLATRAPLAPAKSPPNAGSPRGRAQTAHANATAGSDVIDIGASSVPPVAKKAGRAEALLRHPAPQVEASRCAPASPAVTVRSCLTASASRKTARRAGARRREQPRSGRLSDLWRPPRRRIATTLAAVRPAVSRSRKRDEVGEAIPLAARRNAVVAKAVLVAIARVRRVGGGRSRPPRGGRRALHRPWHFHMSHPIFEREGNEPVVYAPSRRRIDLHQRRHGSRRRNLHGPRRAPGYLRSVATPSMLRGGGGRRRGVSPARPPTIATPMMRTKKRRQRRRERYFSARSERVATRSLR